MGREQIVENYPAISSFAKGINESVNEQLLSIDEASVASNVDVTGGTLARCKGFKEFNEATVPSGHKTLLKHYTDGTGAMLVAVGKEMYKFDGDKFVKIKSDFTNNNFTYINYQTDLTEITIMANGKDPTVVYDGKEFRTLKHSGKDSSELAPKGKYLALHKERVWITGDEENPNRAYFSKDFDIDNWDAPVDEIGANYGGGFIEIPSWDGGIIIGMKSLFDDVVIFKNKNVFRVFGTYPGNYNLVQVFDTVDGDILNNTITSLENSVVWASTDGIHSFNGTNTTLLSERIKETYSRINREYSHLATAVIHNRKYILSIPIDDSKENNLIIELDMETGALVTKSGINATSFLELGKELYFTNKDDIIYLYNTGDDFGGKPIQMRWESGYLSFGEQQARKILNRIYFTAKGPGKVKITCSTDRKDVHKIIDIDDEFKFYRQRLRNKGRFLRIIIENVDGCELELREFQGMLDIDYD